MLGQCARILGSLLASQGQQELVTLTSIGRKGLAHLAPGVDTHVVVAMLGEPLRVSTSGQHPDGLHTGVELFGLGFARRLVLGHDSNSRAEPFVVVDDVFVNGWLSAAKPEKTCFEVFDRIGGGSWVYTSS